MNIRKIILDTETTGINKLGVYYYKHRIIEIGAIEIINRKITGNEFHKYINPNRLVDKQAYNIHKINNNFLKNKPYFYEICDEFIKFIENSELIIHNAKFDVDFINYELNLINHKIKDINSICNITDSLFISRKKFPGKRNSLDALCERYNISKRNIHGALMDSKILAKIYLLLTSGQIKFELNFNKNNFNNKLHFNAFNINKVKKFSNLKIIFANNNEIKEHKNFLQYIRKKYRLDLSENI